MARPKLIAFDLDYTLWPFWIDTHVSPPFQIRANGKIVDSLGQTVECCPGMTDMLKQLKSEGYTLAVASRTGEVQGANQLIGLLGWADLFTYKQIYPGSKLRHFSYFQKESGLPYSDMLFFDDEMRNITELSKVGVKCIHVKNAAMTTDLLKKGFKIFNPSLGN